MRSCWSRHGGCGHPARRLLGAPGGPERLPTPALARSAAQSQSGGGSIEAATQHPEHARYRERITPGGILMDQQPSGAQYGEPGIRPSGTSRNPRVAASNAPSGGQRPYPTTDPISQAELEQLAAFIQNARNLLVITGAGCSTESDIPDYRGPAGAYSTGYKPMTHQQFMASDANRSRYWQRSYSGYHEFAGSRCNDAHHALQQLEGLGWVRHIVTQNVDRLHQKAGSRRVVELHGTTHRVICTGCGDTTDRKAMQEALSTMNSAATLPRLSAVEANTDPALDPPPGVKRPDGDTDAALSDAFRFPSCTRCEDGVLKPDVVFFGDNVPKARAARAMQLAQEADAILVVGSSLMVYSVFRLIKAAKANGAALAILTAGQTRADDLADLKLEYLAGETLARLARHPSLAIPPGH
eukprot:jgi/Tetstr1/458782/TSEL_045166.t1